MASAIDRGPGPGDSNHGLLPPAKSPTAADVATPDELPSATSAASRIAHHGSDNEDEHQVASPSTARDTHDTDETLSPSSIHNTPPYWLSSSAHQRTGSAVSSESALPVGAITLRDNETSEQSDRNNACWAKSVEVVDHMVINGSSTSIGAFVVWIIRVETLNGSYMNIRKRYSEFDDFRDQLVQSFPNYEAAVPQLPPKSVISKFRPRFLEKRRIGLQYFSNCIILNPEFSGSPVLKEFLFA